MKCEECKYWDFTEDVVPPNRSNCNPKHEKYPIGACRRYPPIFKAEDSDNFCFIDDFPMVGAGGWCGEFDEKLKTE